MGVMGVPARLSARLCASLQYHGELDHDLLDIPAGHLRGREEFFRIFSDGARPSGPETGLKANLSKTAGADVFGHRLNPEKGQHRWGRDPSLRSQQLRQFGSNLGDPETAFGRSMGGRLSEDVVLPGLVPRERFGGMAGQ